MTLEELDRTFPNALDDALVRAIAIDYTERTATLQLDMRGKPPDSPDRDVYSRAVLTMRGLCYLSIDPPDAEHLSGPENKPLTVDGDSEDPQEFPQLRYAQSKLGDRAFYCCFF